MYLYCVKECKNNVTKISVGCRKLYINFKEIQLYRISILTFQLHITERVVKQKYPTIYVYVFSARHMMVNIIII